MLRRRGVWEIRRWRDGGVICPGPISRNSTPHPAVAVLPVAATEQHGPHLPVGVDDFINAGIPGRRDAADAGQRAGAAHLPRRQVQRAPGVSRHPDAQRGNADPAVDRDRRVGRARRVAQVRHAQQPWRPAAGDGHRGARPARATRPVRRRRQPVRPECGARPVRRRGGPPRHPRRRLRGRRRCSICIRSWSTWRRRRISPPPRSRWRRTTATCGRKGPRWGSVGRRRTCIPPARAATPRQRTRRPARGSSPPPRRGVAALMAEVARYPLDAIVAGPGA